MQTRTIEPLRLEEIGGRWMWFSLCICGALFGAMMMLKVKALYNSGDDGDGLNIICISSTLERAVSRRHA